MSINDALNGQHRARQIVAALFVDTVDHAISHNRLPCATLVYTALNVLVRKTSDDVMAHDIRTVMRHHPDVLRACTRFLMAPRSSSDIAQLATAGRLESQGCACRFDAGTIYDELHHPERLNMTPRHRGLDNVLLPITSTLQMASARVNRLGVLRAISRANRNVLPGRRRPWPANMDDMVPLGLQQSISNLCAWAEVFLHVALRETVYTVYVNLAHYTSPSILLTDIIPRVFIPITDSIVAQWNSKSHTPHGALDTLHLLKEARNDTIVAGGLGIVQARHILRRCTFDGQALVDLCLRVYSMVCDIRVLLGGPSREVCDEVGLAFLTIACRFHQVLGLPRDPQRYPAAFLRTLDQWQATTQAGQIYELSVFHAYLYRPHICGYRMCARTRQLFRCSGCGHMFYCSRACQKAAWRSDLAPHRMACGILRRVLEPVDRQGGKTPSPDMIKTLAAEGINRPLTSELIVHLSEIYSR